MALTKANSTVIDTTDTGNAIKTNSAVGLAPLDSPTFIGSPSAPTQANSDNTTRLATTAYVTTKTNFLAPVNSPAFTGTPTAPTATTGNNSTQIATTAFVMANSSTTAATTYGAIGSSYLNSTTGILTVNTNYVNGTVTAPGIIGTVTFNVSLPPGTWKCLGSVGSVGITTTNCITSSSYINLFVRVA
jgi:hypothetical protein